MSLRPRAYLPRSRRPRPRRPAGIALIMTLVVVMLLTAYISESFFSTGLELRSMRTFKDAAKARGMARLAFKAAQAGLMLEETIFFANYRNMKKVLTHTAIPWQDGLLVEMEIIPLDGLFNLNELDARSSTDRDKLRWNLFRNTMADIEIDSDIPGLPPEPLNTNLLADMYAALVDWVDRGDNAAYQGVSTGAGAEQAAYLSTEPELTIKNGLLDRLSEIRLVRGVVESKIPWGTWQNRYSALPKTGDLYPEKLNVNLATREEIQAFLERRGMEDMGGLSSTARDEQTAINKYAGSAETIAARLAPEDPQAKRTTHDKTSLEQILRSAGGLNVAYAKHLFSFANENYRLRIITSFNDVDARLEAKINISRNKERIGTATRVLYMTLQ